MVLPLLVAAGLEALAGARVVVRMLRTAGGAPLGPGRVPDGTISAIVPVLEEEHRVGAALAALSACAGELAEILVVDGGSRDGTRAVVARAAAGDPRIRLIASGPAPNDWNGKAWNLEVGLAAARGAWVATIDADVRVGPALLAAATARAQRDGLTGLSVATRQELADAGSALLHPALLATLVYRAGLPNVATAFPRSVQANGQVFAARRDALVRSGAFRAARASRCEDVTAARALAAAGGRVGFFEGDAVVRMYGSWRECAASWPRSLSLRDAYVPPAASYASLAEVLLAQALPLPTLCASIALRERRAAIAAAVLVLVRLGVLAGTRRAYVSPPWPYWLSPLADLPAVALVIAAALRRSHVWRGRRMVPELTLGGTRSDA